MKKFSCILLCVCLFSALITPRVGAIDGAVSAKSYILIEATTGMVVDSKNEKIQMPIASTTKIMTALITVEQKELDKLFTVDSNAIKVEGSSMGLVEGDKASLFALANGMLLSSGNDSANAAAVKISGSVEKFAKLMNERASQLGMVNSHFVTPSGLHDEEHYSTAYDMALLAKAAIRNDRFLSICSKNKARVEFGNPPHTRYLANHNRLVKEYTGCIGVKTGFTKKAGRCLVSAATRDGVTLICVTLDASNDWQDHTRLLDYGFSVVKPVEITASYENIKLNVVGSKDKTISVMPLDKTYGCVNPEMKLIKEIYADKFYYAPIKKGDIVGQIRHLYNGNVVATTELVASQDVKIDIVQKEKTLIKKIKEFLSKNIR